MLKAIGSRKNLENLVFYACISDIIDSESLQALKNYTHHHSTTRFQHSVNVAYYNYRLCSFLRLDARAAARGGLLHDLFYYDRKEYVREKGERFHNSRHPRIACENATREFDISELERDIILKHMWPMTPLTVPRHRESVAIVLVDKYCAVLEVSSMAISAVADFAHINKNGKRRRKAA